MKRITVILLACATAATLAAQTDPPKTTITMSGCVARDTTPGQFTFTEKDGSKYRLTGTSVRRFVGQYVEIVGGPDSRRVKVKGGLWPSPNAAGQAGALDPTRAAVAAAPGGTSSATGDVQLPEFRVNRVRSVAGECP